MVRLGNYGMVRSSQVYHGVVCSGEVRHGNHGQVSSVMARFGLAFPGGARSGKDNVALHGTDRQG